MADTLRILWLKTGPLHPLDTGGKLRTYHLLKELNRQHDVTYFALKDPALPSEDPSIVSASEYSTRQEWFDWSEVSKQSFGFFIDLLKNFLFSRRPYVIDKYQSAAMLEAIRRKDERGEVDVIVCDFLTPAINLYPLKTSRLKTPTLLFQHNVEAQIWKRMAEQAKGLLQRAYLRRQWRRMQAFEATRSAQMDAVVGVSKLDCDQMQRDYGLRNVIGDVATGVDVDYFAPGERKPDSNQIVFLGSMDWLPNIDAVAYFAEEIWPGVRDRNPEARFVIVGRRPTAAVKELAERDGSITVTGTVPDVRPYVEEALAVVVPLRIGGGTRIKIFEAMSMGTPVISTTIGAEGLDVRHQENILIEDAPDRFGEAISMLLNQRERGDQLGHAAAAHVRKHYSWSVVAKDFEAHCRATAEAGNSG